MISASDSSGVRSRTLRAPDLIFRGKTLKDSDKLFLRHHESPVSWTHIFLTGFSLPFVLRVKPADFCCMICTPSVSSLLVLSRLCFGRCRFALRLIPIALLHKFGIVGRLVTLTTFRFECLSDLTFLKSNQQCLENQTCRA
jgi:hypothetical protein